MNENTVNGTVVHKRKSPFSYGSTPKDSYLAAINGDGALIRKSPTNTEKSTMRIHLSFKNLDLFGISKFKD